MGERARRLLLELLHSGIDAVRPEPVVKAALRRRAGEPFTAVVATGKAGPGMTRAALSVLGDLPALVVSDHAEPVPPGVRLLLAGHPLPDERSLRAGAAVLELAGSLSEADRLLYLLSGGTSALVESLRDPLLLEDLAVTTSLLLEAGATIHELNAVRTAMSRIKGGGVAVASAPAPVVTIAISDVTDDDPAVIGSGPTTRPVGIDPRTVLERYGLTERIPDAVGELLAAPPLPAPLTEPELQIVASGPIASAAVVAEARGRGLAAAARHRALGGHAREAARSVIREFRRSAGVDVLVLDGETTVVVAGDGAGGRNQEAALAAAIELDGSDDIAFLAAGTDGIDGPTDAAGGVVDGTTAGRGRALGRDPGGALERNDSHPWLAATGALVTTGPTGTNVGDLWILVRQEALESGVA